MNTFKSFKTLSIFIFLFLSLLAPRILHAQTWSVMDSGSTSNLEDVWSAASNDVFAVGGSGTILHYDGNSWSPMTSGVTNSLYGVWGTASNDVFAGGKGVILHYDGSSWSSMTTEVGWIQDFWGAASNDVFAVAGSGGSNGAIYHYDGNSWSFVWPEGVFPSDLWGVWGVASNDVFAVSQRATIPHYDGNSWSLGMNQSGYGGGYGIWGAASNDVFTVGASGTILHYDGNSWSFQASLTEVVLRNVWGTASNDVFAVGDSGAIFHYNGNSWSSMTSGTASGLKGVWGSASNDVFAVGRNGTILHYSSGTTTTCLDPVLVAYYPFNGNANDESGNGNHATVNGATLTTDRNGNNNSAYSFDGNDYIQTPVDSNIKPLSFSVWFKADGSAGEHSIVDSDVSSKFGHSLIIGYVQKDGDLDVQYHNSYMDSGYSITTGTWYHAVVNFSSEIELYVNGSLVSQQAYTATSFDGSNFRFGRHNSGDPQWFTGKIDDVRFYDCTLSESEIQELYGGGTTKTCTYSISPASESFDASGGPGSISVSTANGCNWTATSNKSWITITTNDTGTGNGPISYSVSANTGTSSRTGTITIAGKTFTVTQSGTTTTCTYSITPTSEAFDSSGGPGSVSVSTAIDCSWTATSNESWITITTAELVDAADDNTNPSYHDPVTWSAYIDPSITNWIGFHNTTTTTVIDDNDYIGGGQQWIGLVNDFLDLTITNTSTGAVQTHTMDYNDAMGNESGIQSVIFGAADAAPDVYRMQDPFGTRDWVIYNEAGAFNAFITTADTYTFSMTYGNTGSSEEDHLDMYFLVDTTDSGTGSGPISYSVSANTGTSSRTGTMTIAGETFTVTQEGSDDDLSAPTNFSATVDGCTTSIFGASCTVSLSWTGVSAASGYKLYYGFSSGSYGAPVNLGNVTSATFDSVPFGTYYLAISAYDSNGNESSKSGEIVLIVGETSVPTNFSATVSDCIEDVFGNISSCTVTLSWTGVSGPSGYRLYYGFSSGNYVGSINVGNVTSLTYSGIAKGIYYLALTAYDSGGVEGGYSGELILEVGSNSVNSAVRAPSPFPR